MHHMGQMAPVGLCSCRQPACLSSQCHMRHSWTPGGRRRRELEECIPRSQQYRVAVAVLGFCPVCPLTVSKRLVAHPAPLTFVGGKQIKVGKNFSFSSRPSVGDANFAGGPFFSGLSRIHRCCYALRSIGAGNLYVFVTFSQLSVLSINPFPMTLA